jgi:hypothetical protein
MAIQSAGEFEIIVNNMVMRLNRRLDEQPNNTTLVQVKRTIEESVGWAKAGVKLEPRALKTFSDATDRMREAFRADTQLSDQLFDLLDYLEYRVG